MKLSTRARYGTRALLDVALHNDGRPVVLKDIGNRQQISVSYLEHLVIPLISAGILRSERGKRGGLLLARPPAQIRLSEVVRVLEGSLALTDCVRDPKSCPRSGSCATEEIWDEMSKAMEKVLESTTLEDLVDRQRRKEPVATYEI